MANKIVKMECMAEKKVFLDAQSGNSYPYWAVTAIVNGQPIKLSVPKESKALLNYLLDGATDKN